MKKSTLLLSALAASLVTSALAGPQQSHDSTLRQSRQSATLRELPDSLRAAVLRSQLVGDAQDQQKIYLAVCLELTDLAGLEELADSVSDPSSPSYRQFITPEEVGERFGASSADVEAVVSYLKSKGMTIDFVNKNRTSVMAYATVAQAESAFSTQIRQYVGRDPRGLTISYRSNSTPLMLPARLARVVTAVQGVEDYTRPYPRQVFNPLMTRNVYNSTPLYSLGMQGQGRKIAYSNWDGYRLSNIPLYVAAFGLPVPGGGVGTNIHQVSIGGANGNVSGVGGEGDLDLQMELGMAPLADIYIYDNANQADLIGVLSREVSDNLADVISESWGWQLPASFATSAHAQHISMTVQGITYMCASGDNGTSLDPFSYPNYEPEVLQVGGTVCTTNGTVRTSEVGWGGSGGGWSTNSATFNVLPSWQVGTGVPTNINKRLVPDIGLHASGGNTGAFFFYANGSLQGGAIGTSFSSPIFAGCLALVEQRLAFFGLAPRFGRIQDLIYSQNGRTDVWFDITSGNNGTLPNGSPSNCTAKWDTVTGWGAPNIDMFFHSVALVVKVPTTLNVFRGQITGGNVGSLASSDNDRLSLRPFIVLNASESPVDINFTATTNVLQPFALKFRVESMGDTPGLTQRLWLWNFLTNGWEQVDSRGVPLSDTSFDVSLAGNLTRFVDGAGNIKGRLDVRATGPVLHSAWIMSFDVAHWRFTP